MSQLELKLDRDLWWAAGFLEGDGSFGCTGSPHVRAVQKNEEPIRRLKKSFGGRVSGFMKKSRRYWSWRLDGPPARELILNLYPLLSPARQFQITSGFIRYLSTPVHALSISYSLPAWTPIQRSQHGTRLEGGAWLSNLHSEKKTKTWAGQQCRLKAA